MADLKSQTLNVSVWHNNSFGRNIFLGEVDLDLSEWDFNNTEINEYTLKSRVKTCLYVASKVQEGLDFFSLKFSSGSIRNPSSIDLTSNRKQGADESGSEICGTDIQQWAAD